MPEDPALLVESCPSCGARIDVSGLEPLTEVSCPSCGENMFARRYFNNYTLLQLLGRGGMGSVFKAVDNRLQREVALKILRTEMGGSAEEKDRLAAEARRTATINHPNVVKVFSFGEDGGQFYLAMELVEKGSLDDLMSLQSRVPELQVLDVGIQIASGLQAAFEVGMIHRDIKPGNILFADAGTAKLVDFGLALVMDEVAAEKGEIWGTPYYVAPEKLDGGEEDFRSDMYSLGGTLFHALAGRPPYEAETASMVALKQLKSHEVSLQSFAPDVSSETSYVINRMMSKSPDARYPDYADLISHLAYAKQKLLERIRQGSGKRQHVLVESRQQKTVIGLITLGMILAFAALGVVAYLNFDRIADSLGWEFSSGISWTPQSASNVLDSARDQFLEGRSDRALEDLRSLTNDAGAPQPQKNWARLEMALYLLLLGQPEQAREVFTALQSDAVFSTTGELLALGSFFAETARLCLRDQVVAPGTLRVYNRENFETYAFFLYGVHDLSLGYFDQGRAILDEFLETTPPGGDRGIIRFQPLAKRLSAGASALLPLARRAEGALPSDERESLLEELEKAASSQAEPVLQIGLEALGKRVKTKANG